MNNNLNNLNNNQDKENEQQKEKKMAEIEKKSALPIFSVGTTWIVCAIIFKGALRTPTVFFITVVLSFIVYQIVKSKCPPKKIEIKLENKPLPKHEKFEDKIKKEKIIELTPEERELKDLNERMDLYLIEVKLLNDSIGDEFISNELFEIEKTLKKIQVQLNDEAKISSRAKRAEQLSEFFDYYMPATVKILNSYRRIEKQSLTGENATETKKRVEESLPFIRKAFEKELDNMFSEEMLDITTDIDVLEAMLSKDGLMEKNSINDFKDIKNDIKNDFFN